MLRQSNFARSERRQRKVLSDNRWRRRRSASVARRWATRPMPGAG